jgi:hypothetical protein
VLDDVQWTLERQREALDAERVRWPQWPADPIGPRVIDYTEGQLAGLHQDLIWLHTEIAMRDAIARRHEAEITLRDAQITHLTAQIDRAAAQAAAEAGA